MQTYLGAFDSPVARNAALFKVSTDRGDVLMAVHRTERGDDERAIVEVRRDAVLGLWRNWTASEREVAASLRAGSASLQHTLDNGEHAFVLGGTVPLPLSEVRCRVRARSTVRSGNAAPFVGTTTQPYVAVADGAARMLWLTSNGARCFPVECAVAEAPLLAKLAGTRRSRWLRVSELLPR